jgi:hypothetical protein
MACRAPIDPELEVSAEQPVRVRATVDRDRATIGDRITYTLEVAHAENLTVRLPQLPETLGGMRVEPGGESPEPARRQGQVVERRSYRLVTDRVGAAVIPPLEVAYGADGEPAGAVSTPELRIKVASVLAEAEAEAEAEATDIRDVKPLHRHSRPWPALGFALAGVVALAVLAAWLWWRRRRRAASASPALPPHEAALQALARLRLTDFSDPEALRAYYFALSETLRTYVEGRFGLNATDLTSEEILAGLGALRELAAFDAERLREFLDATDRVKFAKRFPTKRQIEETFETAVCFVESTRPPESGEPPAEPAGPGSPPERPPHRTTDEGAPLGVAEEGGR